MVMGGEELGHGRGVGRDGMSVVHGSDSAGCGAVGHVVARGWSGPSEGALYDAQTAARAGCVEGERTPRPRAAASSPPRPSASRGGTALPSAARDSSGAPERRAARQRPSPAAHRAGSSGRRGRMGRASPGRGWMSEAGEGRMPMFDGFELTRCEGDGARLRVRHGGSGPAVLLLHGHPRTHATWHRVAPLLVSAGHTVVCPDLRGYGRSEKPPTDARHRPYSKRAMAGDCLAVMRGLGHDRFAVVGHDRGAYVATRLALDHPEAVSAVSVLDAVPIGEALRRCDPKFAASWWHWFLPRADRQARRTRHQRGPRRLVQGHGRADGSRGVRGLPGRSRCRPRARRRRPAGGPAHRPPAAGAVGHP
ncbi:alpha/beta fold hydrolase [Streptomyces collinus]|uniref:alpha/beta fold hydrolase n=1 Tax=Streptomyces collinus TaxID=42684 RepID=UPI0036BA5ED4